MVTPAAVKTAFYQFFNQPDLSALSADDRIQALLMLLVDAGGGGGGGGGTSQETIEAAIEASDNLADLVAEVIVAKTAAISCANSLGLINPAMGGHDTAPATADNSASGLVSLIKRLLGVKLPNAVNNRIPVVHSNIITTYTQGNVLVNTESTQVVDVNSSRKHLLLANRGTTICYINFGNAASTNSLPLNPAPETGQVGGIYEINQDNLFMGAINAICDSGSTTIAVAEGV